MTYIVDLILNGIHGYITELLTVHACHAAYRFIVDMMKRKIFQYLCVAMKRCGRFDLPRIFFSMYIKVHIFVVYLLLLWFVEMRSHTWKPDITYNEKSYS